MSQDVIANARAIITRRLSGSELIPVSVISHLLAIIEQQQKQIKALRSKGGKK